MTTRKTFISIFTLCIALLFTACGTQDSAKTANTKDSVTKAGTEASDNSNARLNDLYQQENQLFAKHEAVWNKAFGMMNKSTVDPNCNYADYLAGTVESNKASFTEAELKTLTEDIDAIRKIEEQTEIQNKWLKRIKLYKISYKNVDFLHSYMIHLHQFALSPVYLFPK